MAKKKLGELLLDASQITRSDLDRALEVQKSTGERLGATLMRLGLVTQGALAEVLAEQYDTEAVALEEECPTSPALDAVSEAEAFELGCVPLSLDDGVLRIALADPTDRDLLDRLAALTGHRIEALVAPQMAIYRSLKRHYGERLAEGDVAGIRRRLGEIRRLLAEVEGILPGAD